MEAEFEEIGVTLKASNFFCNFEMFISRQKEDQGEEEFYFTLFGWKDGKRLQFDFEELSRREIEEIKIAIELLLETEHVCELNIDMSHKCSVCGKQL